MTTCLTFKKPYENQLPEFIEEYLKGKGFAIEGEAVQVLCESVGVDLNRLATEMDKVLTAKPQGYAITREDVMSQVGMSREFNVFELQKALIKMDVVRACQIADYFGGNTRKIRPSWWSLFSSVFIASCMHWRVIQVMQARAELTL